MISCANGFRRTTRMNGGQIVFEVGNRIFGGEKAEKGEFPWLVALFHREVDIFFCSGSLISNKHVLSGVNIFVIIN